MCLQYLYAIMVKETSPMTTEFVINNRIYILHTISSFIFHLAILGVYFNGTLSSPCLHTHMSHTYTPTHTHTQSHVQLCTRRDRPEKGDCQRQQQQQRQLYIYVNILEEQTKRPNEHLTQVLSAGTRHVYEYLRQPLCGSSSSSRENRGCSSIKLLGPRV